MKTEIDLFNIRPEDKIPARGKMLISEPFLPDSFFNRTLVYLTEHTDKGSVGFILNKTIDIRLSDALEGFAGWNEKLSMGGPVSPETLHYIHTLGDLVPDSVQVSGNIFWGGSIDAIKALIASGRVGKEQVRFFLGYSGWGEGQLEKELEENSWVIGNALPGLVMSYRSADSWKQVLRTMNKRYSIWAEFPDSPEMN